MDISNAELKEILLRIEAKLDGEKVMQTVKIRGIKNDNSVREQVTKLMDDGNVRTSNQIYNLLKKAGCTAKRHSIDSDLSNKVLKGEILRLGTGIYQKKA